MSRRITVGAALALALLLVAASIPLTMMFAQSEQNKLIPKLPELIGKFNALDEIQRKVYDKFYASPAEDAVNAAMVSGYIAGLGDPESRYLSPEEYQSFMQRLAGEEPELGIVLRYSPELAALVIDQVKAGSTAEVSGLKRGDHIVKAVAGGQELSIKAEVEPDKAADEIAAFYKETAVTADTSSLSITITYERDGKAWPPVNVMLGSAVSSISAYMMDSYAGSDVPPTKTIGYIKIFHFFKNTAEQIAAAVKDLSRQGAESYILDVRGCSEGNLEYVCEAIDLFAYVPQDTGALVTVHYRDGTPVFKPSTSGNMMSYTTGGFVAVLINGRTSGVAELFAYDLREFNQKKVFLIGEPTKGIKTMQEPYPLASVGGAALLTVGTLVPYGGNTAWNEGGVQPGAATEEDTARGVARGILYHIKGVEQQQLNGALLMFDILGKDNNS
ncbi:MAG: hypothetical protein LBB75_04380 [Oscillospiraceae bacterium]|jgi:carboxyl-terminal processing protease|nr:hypothetical protein [Oscillospiraceae bacterium]